MGIEYYVLCDDDHTAFELGKGGWWDLGPAIAQRSACLRHEVARKWDDGTNKDVYGGYDYGWRVGEKLHAWCESKGWRSLRLVNDSDDHEWWVARPGDTAEYTESWRRDGLTIYQLEGDRYEKENSMRIDEETLEVGVGPITLNVAMARRLGWSEPRIAAVGEAIAMLSRGAGASQDMEDGKLCEHCFARTPEKKYTPCVVCDGTGARKIHYFGGGG